MIFHCGYVHTADKSDFFVKADLKDKATYQHGYAAWPIISPNESLEQTVYFSVSPQSLLCIYFSLDLSLKCVEMWFESHFKPPPTVVWIWFAKIAFHVFCCCPDFLKSIWIQFGEARIFWKRLGLAVLNTACVSQWASILELSPLNGMQLSLMLLITPVLLQLR